MAGLQTAKQKGRDVILIGFCSLNSECHWHCNPARQRGHEPPQRQQLLLLANSINYNSRLEAFISYNCLHPVPAEIPRTLSSTRPESGVLGAAAVWLVGLLPFPDKSQRRPAPTHRIDVF